MEILRRFGGILRIPIWECSYSGLRGPLSASVYEEPCGAAYGFGAVCCLLNPKPLHKKHAGNIMRSAFK